LCQACSWHLLKEEIGPLLVVDIETTGGWASGDRITEIGAVKIRNHEVVGEWHSLLNPQRPIPSKIVQLTGITNDMARGAPLFAEVAENFVQIMEDGIFVAHNVNSDYGFIAREYERLERRFRFPKLCTCAGRRRRFPGHRSYGLGSLRKTYGIDLEEQSCAVRRQGSRAAAEPDEPKAGRIDPFRVGRRGLTPTAPSQWIRLLRGREIRT
jgi:DNA polymerase III epsilon subunit family exonuclease